MTNLSIVEFRRQPGEILNRVKYNGESFCITKLGKPVALLTPFRTRIKPEPTIAKLKSSISTRNCGIAKMAR